MPQPLTHTGLLTLAWSVPQGEDVDAAQGHLIRALEQQIHEVTRDERKYRVEPLIATRSAEDAGTVIRVSAVIALMDPRDAEIGECVIDDAFPGAKPAVRLQLPGLTFGSRVTFERERWATMPGVEGYLYKRIA